MTIMEALGGHVGDVISKVLGGSKGETIMEALGGSKGETIMEAKGGSKGETIMETLGGSKGQTIAKVIEDTGFVPDSETVDIYTVSYNANGGSGSIESVEVAAGESITLSDGTGLTAPEGKQFSGWAKSSTASSATVNSPFTPTKNTILYAVWINA